MNILLAQLSRCSKPIRYTLYTEEVACFCFCALARSLSAGNIAHRFPLTRGGGGGGGGGGGPSIIRQYERLMGGSSRQIFSTCSTGVYLTEADILLKSKFQRIYKMAR